jgi:tetratricopeptide (TPR) repeat protein
MAGLDRGECVEELQDAGVGSRDHRKRIVDVCSTSATKSTQSVAVAWRLNVQELSAPARRVLNVVSLMASDGIPEGEFLADAVNAAVDPGTTLLDQASIDAVLVELGKLSLISRGQGAHTHWRVHRLLQLFGRLCMDDEARRCANFGLGTALQRALQSLDSAIGDEQRARLFALVPHAVSVVQHVHAGGFGADEAVVAAGDQAGAVLLDWQSRFAQARSVFLHGLKIRRKVFGGDDAVHANIATSLSNLGNVFYAEGDYAAARTYYDQALAMKRTFSL